jgi:hypothetical protein
MSLRYFRAISEYEVSYPRPVVFQTGDSVKIIKSDASWPGWVWVETSDGNQGWAPRSVLSVGSAETGDCLASAAYNGTELSAAKGERLEGLHEESGWVWCRRDDGSEGWFPLFNLKPEGITPS